MNLDQERALKIFDSTKNGKRWSWEEFSNIVDIRVPKNGKRADHTQWVVDRNCKLGEQNGLTENEGKLWRLKVNNTIGVEKIGDEELLDHTAELAFERVKAAHERWAKKLEGMEDDFKEMGFDIKQTEKMRMIIEGVSDLFLGMIERSRTLGPLKLLRNEEEAGVDVIRHRLK